ncbi:methylosome protein 50-like [Schistocerca cancellata]|uniref:methylosome protein 50-like n=1 Tax=Schistocerca cancellata TaxID=274614 RepID=UPI00211746B4|nr:methylosome protein 50-like [Schistocerca cancellata]
MRQPAGGGHTTGCPSHGPPSFSAIKHGQRKYGALCGEGRASRRRSARHSAGSLWAAQNAATRPGPSVRASCGPRALPTARRTLAGPYKHAQRRSSAFPIHWLQQQEPVTGTAKYLDIVEIAEDGSTLLGCSELTGRFWCGSLWYSEDAELTPDVYKCLTGVDRETSVCDGKFPHKYKIVVDEDSGVIQVLAPGFPEDTCLGSACEHDDSVSSLSTFNDKKKVVSGSFDCSIKVWDIETLPPEHTYRPAHAHHVTSVTISRMDRCLLASTSLDGTALLWDTRKSQPSSVLFSDIGFTSVDWRPLKFEFVVVGSTTGDIFTVDVRHPKQPLDTLTVFSRPVYKLRFSSCHDLLAACAESTEVKVFDFKSDTATEIYSDDRHKDFVRGIAWHQRDTSFYTCGWDKQVFRLIPSEASAEMEVNEVGGDRALS